MTDLIERIESAKGPNRELDADICQFIGGPVWDALYREAQLPCGCPHDTAVERARELAGYRHRYTASIDAALTLVPDDCPRWAVTGRNSAVVERADGRIGTMDWVFAATPALALCAAALRARGKQP